MLPAIGPSFHNLSTPPNAACYGQEAFTGWSMGLLAAVACVPCATVVQWRTIPLSSAKNDRVPVLLTTEGVA